MLDQRSNIDLRGQRLAYHRQSSNRCQASSRRNSYPWFSVHRLS